jgi:hypothetical protein
MVILPGVDENSVIKEGGTEVGTAEIAGVSKTEDGNILVSAGSYVFTVE